jgi:YD repeat-containing protein
MPARRMSCPVPCRTPPAAKTLTRNRYGQVVTFTDCSGYQTRYEYNRTGQITAIHQEEGLSQYFIHDGRGRLISQKNAQGHETHYEYNTAGDLTAVIYPDGSRSETQYDAAGHPVSVNTGGLTRSLEYDAAGRVTGLTNENGATTTFAYDVMDRLVRRRALTAGRSVMITTRPASLSAARTKVWSRSGITTMQTA